MDKDQPAPIPTDTDPYVSADPSTAAPSEPRTVPNQGMSPNTFTNLAPHDPSLPAQRPRRALLFGLIAVAALLLIGGGVYATFLRQTPEQKIKKAFAGMAGLDSFALDGSLTSNGGFTGTLNGQFDSKAEAFTLQLTASIVLNTVKLDLVGIKDILYLKTDGVVGIVGGLVGIERSDLSKLEQLLESKHVRISPEDSPGRLLGMESSTAPPTTPQISEADKEKIAKLVENTEFFKVSEKLGSKDIKGTNATGYKIVLQAEGIKQLARGLRDVESLKSLFANQNEQQLEQGLAETKQADLDKVPFEVWLSGERIARVAIELAEGQSKGRVEFDFSRFDEGFNIQAPADSRPFSEVLPGLQSAFSEFNPGPNLITPSTLQ